MNELIQQLVAQAIQERLIEQEDAIYARNRILARIGQADFEEQADVPSRPIPDILDDMIEVLIVSGQLPARLEDKEQFAADVMDIFVARPSDVTAAFRRLYAESPVAATDYFYQLSQASNYIQTKRIAKNKRYQAETVYGTIDVTINLSKPEKDPREIAAARTEAPTASNYPTCLLCVENVGYAGRANHPARANHRVVPLTLMEESWALQYSPYVYYNEHSIILSQEHRDMVINRDAFARLIAFVEQFPHYFAGSNADLPIVAGETLHWPLSVLRLKSKDASALLNAATTVYETWLTYTDESQEIRSHTGETRHNTVTPIARQRDGQFELDLVLRNNRTSAEHPDGIFHTHADIHHIKRENIGLIEVMGLAVLPARLLQELQQVEQFITGEVDEVAAAHADWAQELKQAYVGQHVTTYVEQAVAAKFVRGLEDCGVFKQTEEGQAAFGRFVQLVTRQPVEEQR